MKDTFVSETRYHTKIVVITGILMISAALVLFALFFLLYNVSKKNKFDDWQENVNRLAEEVDACIQMPVNAISFSAATLNKMTSENRPHEEALSYLKSETEIYASLIPENSTGIYSYYRGEYLDGSGWLAPEGYQPTHRPWYTAAVANQGKITLVEPFLNLQTVTSMMSISKLLDDKESVVSMDIFLDSIQKSVETRMASEKCIEDAMVIDRSGAVIAHSDIALLSKNLAESGSSFDKTLAEKLLSEEKSPFQLKDKGTGYTVFFQPTNTIWTSVIVVNSRKLLRSLLSIYLAFFILLAAALAVIFLFYLNLSGKYRETDLLNCEINAIADIYEAVARINLASGDIEPIRTCPQFDALLEGDYSRYSERVPSLAEKIAAPNALILVRDFLETSTLQERMNGVSSISIECLDTKERWIRLRYILIHRDEQGNLATVMLAFESIDEDRRRQENLKKLSETDMMTGVQNRGSGEMKVRSALADGKTGMFCLMDVDNFKSINDNYGHQTGDDVIKAIAECLKKTFRDSDIVFRLGGDEFAVFSEGVTDRNLGKRIIDRFFANVEAISLPALKNRPVCVSVGAAFYPGNSSDTFEDLYAQADSGTYKSKREPGNLLTFIN